MDARLRERTSGKRTNNKHDKTPPRSAPKADGSVAPKAPQSTAGLDDAPPASPGLSTQKIDELATRFRK